MKFLICLLLFGISVAVVDHRFFKKNLSFTIHHIYSTLPKKPCSPLPTDYKQILSQPFYYLKRGHQTYAFVSADGKYVLKCYRFPSHLRRFLFFKPRKNEDVTNYNLTKLKKSFQSYELAFNELREESSLLYIHLYPSEIVNQTITLIDHLQISYQVPLDEISFLLQKRADLLFPKLEKWLADGEQKKIKELQFQLDQLIRIRCQKGIADRDAVLEKNYGWVDGKVIHIDVGSFVKEEGLIPEKEIERISSPLKRWLR